MHQDFARRGIVNRRKCRRYPMLGSIELRASGIGIGVPASLTDISAGGCRVETRVALHAKHAVRLELPRPGRASLRVTGNVVRIGYAEARRMYDYGVRFNVSQSEREELFSYLSFYCRAMTAVSARADQQRGDRHGSAVKVLLRLNVLGSDYRFIANAITIDGAGARIVSDRILRQEWSLKVDIHFPVEVLPGARPVHAFARVGPGVTCLLGRYGQDLIFNDLPLAARAQIERFLHALHTESAPEAIS